MEIAIFVMLIIIAIELAFILYNKDITKKEEEPTRRTVSDAYGYRDPLSGYRTNSRGHYLIKRPNGDDIDGEV